MFFKDPAGEIIWATGLPGVDGLQQGFHFYNRAQIEGEGTGPRDSGRDQDLEKCVLVLSATSTADGPPVAIGTDLSHVLPSSLLMHAHHLLGFSCLNC